MSLDTFKITNGNTTLQTFPEPQTDAPSDPLSHLKGDLQADLEQAIEAFLANKGLSADKTEHEPVSTISDSINNLSFPAAPAIPISKAEYPAPHLIAAT